MTSLLTQSRKKNGSSKRGSREWSHLVRVYRLLRLSGEMFPGEQWNFSLLLHYFCRSCLLTGSGYLSISSRMAGGPCTWSRSCICPCFSSPQAVSSFKEAGHSLSLVMSLLFGFQSAPARCSRNKMAQPEVGMQSVVGTASLSHRTELSQKR